MQAKQGGDAQWNELLYDSIMTPQRLTMDKIPYPDDLVSPKMNNAKASSRHFVDHNDIQMELANNLMSGKKDRY